MLSYASLLIAFFATAGAIPLWRALAARMNKDAPLEQSAAAMPRVAGAGILAGAFMSFFYHEALIKLGRFDILLADIRANYGVMVEHDASACWEMYPGSDFRANPKMPTRSHCHAWSAGPAYFLGAYTLGVRGADPGWSTIIVEPQPAGLAWARGVVPLPGGGSVAVSWRLDEPARRIKLRIEAPRSVELLIQPPDGYEADTELVRLG